MTVADSVGRLSRRLADAGGVATARGDGVDSWAGCQDSRVKMLRLWRRPPGSHAEVKQ